MPSSPPPLLSIAFTLSEWKWPITSPKKGQAMQRCHEEQSARSKCARLSPLEREPPETPLDCWKSKVLYRYRPEGIFRIFLAWFWTPPGTYAFTAKKGKFICTGHFFPHGMAFLEKKGGNDAGIRFHFPCDWGSERYKTHAIAGFWRTWWGASMLRSRGRIYSLAHMPLQSLHPLWMHPTICCYAARSTRVDRSRCGFFVSRGHQN